MNGRAFGLLLACVLHGAIAAVLLGPPPLPEPPDNRQTAEKVALGETLFHDPRFSPTGEVSCATRHEAGRAFTDGLFVSRGINGLEGIRNAPTVVNAAYMTTQFWDGREPSLEALEDVVEFYIKGRESVGNFDRGLIRAVAEANLLHPRPDFVIYGGDIAQLGSAAEIDHGLDILGGLRGDVHYVMGEHDYYLDLAEHWERRLAPQHYSFDHKGSISWC